MPRRLLLPLVLACGAAPVAAQTVHSVTLRLDNDILALRGRGAPPDYDYTHGLHLSAELSAAPGALSFLSACGTRSDAHPCLHTRLRLGQEIYTPRRDASTPLPGERPYAAWLYGAAEVVGVGPGRQRSLAVELGVTGPPALGEPVQNGVHRLLGSEPQVGWAHQLRFEPGLLVRYTEWRLFEFDLRRLGSGQLRPGWSISLGNVRTAAQAGASARLGPAPAAGPFLLLEVAREWVARDLFLDGNTFKGNSSAQKLPFVSRGELGVGYAFRAWALEYRFVVRSRQYRAQPGPHGYGSLSVRLRRE
ncbi:MAG: lipid A deacylase LpxR family protein [Gemmatimonadota bacterium]|nr:lipid A deacylase LpxR family protein [Gemmatimonadota bacterium]